MSGVFRQAEIIQNINVLFRHFCFDKVVRYFLPVFQLFYQILESIFLLKYFLKSHHKSLDPVGTLNKVNRVETFQILGDEFFKNYSTFLQIKQVNRILSYRCADALNYVSQTLNFLIYRFFYGFFFSFCKQWCWNITLRPFSECLSKKKGLLRKRLEGVTRRVFLE